MLKAKTKTSDNKRKYDAMKAVLKNDNLVGFHVLLTKAERRKLNIYLSREDISKTYWLKRIIAQL